MEPQNISNTPQRFTISSAWISFLVSSGVLVLKFAGFWVTHSQAVLSDALESIVNVVAAFLALIIMRIVIQPADEEHPYGHGKLEYFSSAFEGGLIAFAALAIGYGAVQAFINGQTLHELETGLILVGVAGVLNFLLGMHLVKVGKKHNSEALRASGHHVLTDVWSTVGVFVGLVLVKLTGYVWIDAIVAIFVAMMLLRSGYQIVRRSIGGLIDEMEPEALKDLARCLSHHRRPGIVDVHNLKLIRSGRFHHIDAHLVVPEFWDVSRAHNEMDRFEKAVVNSYAFDGEIAFHLDPCDKKYCAMCDLQNCQIRQTEFKQLKPFSPESLIKGPVLKSEL